MDMISLMEMLDHMLDIEVDRTGGFIQRCFST